MGDTPYPRSLRRRLRCPGESRHPCTSASASCSMRAHRRQLRRALPPLRDQSHDRLEVARSLGAPRARQPRRSLASGAAVSSCDRPSGDPRDPPAPPALALGCPQAPRAAAGGSSRGRAARYRYHPPHPGPARARPPSPPLPEPRPSRPAPDADHRPHCGLVGGLQVRRVSTNGGIRWNKRWVNVSHSLAELPVGLEPLASGTWNVCLGPVHLGWLDERDDRIHDRRGRTERERHLSPIR